MSRTAYNNLSGMLLLRKTNSDCDLNNFKKQKALQKFITRIFRPVVIGTLLKAIQVYELSHPFNLEFRHRYF